MLAASSGRDPSRSSAVIFAALHDAQLLEVAYAASLNKRFAPIVCRRVEDSAVPEALRRLNFIFFDDPEHFDASAGQLAEALQTDIAWIRRHTQFGEAARHWTDAGLCVGQRHRQEQRQLHRLRQQVGQSTNGAGWLLRTEPIRSL